MKCERCGQETVYVPPDPSRTVPICSICADKIVREWWIRKQEIDVDMHNSDVPGWAP